MNKGKQYFRHDSNAQQDERILALRMKLGWEGYGLYWAIVERLRDSKECQLSKDYNLLGFAFNVSAGKIKQVVEDFGLFTFTDDGERFYSKRLSTDMQAVSDLSNALREAGKRGNAKRWNKEDNASPGDSHPIATPSPGDSHPIATPSPGDSHPIAIKENKRREDSTLSFANAQEESTGKTAGRFVPPTPEEVEAYAREKGYTIDAERFVNFYESKGWMVGKTKMRKWRSAVANWAKDSNSRLPTTHRPTQPALGAGASRFSRGDLHPSESFKDMPQMPFDPSLPHTN